MDGLKRLRYVSWNLQAVLSIYRLATTKNKDTPPLATSISMSANLIFTLPLPVPEVREHHAYAYRTYKQIQPTNARCAGPVPRARINTNPIPGSTPSLKC